MRNYYTGQHQFYCGVDLHARTMYLCVVNQADEILLHREIPTNADRFVRELAPALLAGTPNEAVWLDDRTMGVLTCQMGKPTINSAQPELV